MLSRPYLLTFVAICVCNKLKFLNLLRNCYNVSSFYLPIYVDPVDPIDLVEGIYSIASWIQTTSIHVEGSPASEKTQSCWKQNKALIKC